MLPAAASEYVAEQGARLRAAGFRTRIVFPEGDDARVLEAAARLAAGGLLEPVLIGNGQAPGVRFIEPELSPQLPKYAAIYYERRRAKGITQMEAMRLAAHRLNFAALMAAAGDAEAVIGGCVHTTAEYVRSVLQCIGVQAGYRRASSAHIMAVRDRAFGRGGLLVFSDAAIQVSPGAAELAEIAIAAAATARAVLATEPLVALLSFSTKGSASHRAAVKVAEALRYVRARAPELKIDGELQADAALVAAVGRSKAPGSAVAGRANTLVFPDLNSANIGYKLVERLGNGALLAVALQGVARPAGLISRGCSADDVFNAAIVTAAQAARASAAAP